MENIVISALFQLTTVILNKIFNKQTEIFLYFHGIVLINVIGIMSFPEKCKSDKMM